MADKTQLARVVPMSRIRFAAAAMFIVFGLASAWTAVWGA
jgi:hypothetical protein